METEEVMEKVVEQTQVTEPVPPPAPPSDPEKQAEGKSWNKVVDKLSYKGVVKNIPYLIFVALLAIIYIANNNHAIALVRALNQKNKELKELRWHHMDLQSRLMYQTSESQLKNRTEALGLKPLTEPAFEIKVKTEPKTSKEN